MTKGSGDSQGGSSSYCCHWIFRSYLENKLSVLKKKKKWCFIVDTWKSCGYCGCIKNASAFCLLNGCFKVDFSPPCFLKRNTSRQTKPLKVQVMHSSVAAHQNFGLKALSWLGSIIGYSGRFDMSRLYLNDMTEGTVFSDATCQTLHRWSCKVLL